MHLVILWDVIKVTSLLLSSPICFYGHPPTRTLKERCSSFFFFSLHWSASFSFYWSAAGKINSKALVNATQWTPSQPNIGSRNQWNMNDNLKHILIKYAEYRRSLKKRNICLIKTFWTGLVDQKSMPMYILKPFELVWLTKKVCQCTFHLSVYLCVFLSMSLSTFRQLENRCIVLNI